MTKNQTNVNALDCTKTIMIIDTNILMSLFPKNHRFLHGIDPGSIKHITSSISKDMTQKGVFITDTIKFELKQNLNKKDIQIFEAICKNFQIRTLKDDKKHLRIVNKICNDAYWKSKHKTLVKKKISKTIMDAENRVKTSKIKCEFLFKKRVKPNIKLGNQIENAKHEYNLSKKTQKHLKTHLSYALIGHNDRIILSTAIATSDCKTMVEFYTRDTGFLEVQSIMSEHSIRIRCPSIKYIH